MGTEKESVSAKTDNLNACVPVIKTGDKLTLSLCTLQPSYEGLAYGKKFDFEKSINEDFNHNPFYNGCRISKFLKNVVNQLLSGIGDQHKFVHVAGGVGTGKTTTAMSCCNDASTYFKQTTKKRMRSMRMN